MTKREILLKAIEKAEKNGFDLVEWYSNLFELVRKEVKRQEIIDWLNLHIDSFTKLLFLHHSFAKKFFEETYHTFTENKNGIYLCKYCPAWLIPHECGPEVKYCWQYHIQQMVIEKDCWKYLECRINSGEKS